MPMTKRTLVLEEFLPYRLNRLAGEMSRRLHAIYGDRYGIDVPEWRVLATLGAREPVTAQEIARDTATHKSTISRAVARLEAMGWVERAASASDRRARSMRLTQAGRAAHDEIIPLVLAVEAETIRMLHDHAKPVLQSLEELEAVLGLRDPATFD
jgi:DNA-binding MarR family transcriptional regulator